MRMMISVCRDEVANEGREWYCGAVRWVDGGFEGAEGACKVSPAGFPAVDGKLAR